MWLHYLTLFLNWSAQKNYAQETINSRERSLKRLIAWCVDRGLDTPQDITKPILERYQRHLFYYRKANGEPLSFSTQNSLLQPVKAFFKWLSRENHILYNPASEMELPRLPKQLPKHILSHAEVETILNQALIKPETGVRDRAIIETLYSTGIRRMELVNLMLYDLDSNRGTLMVRQGKGRKDRLLPIGERACAWIQKYLNDLRPGLVVEPDNGVLFINDDGQPFIKNRLGDLVKKIIERAGIHKPGSCHLFRHAMATQMLEHGADIRYIQVMLGHSDLSTTQIYTQVSIKKLQAVHALTHPASLTRKKQATEQDADTVEALRLLAALDTEVGH